MPADCVSTPWPPQTELAVDPTWFPTSFDIATEEIGFHRLSGDSIAAAAFLDQRTYGTEPPRLRVPWRQLPTAAPSTPPLSWIFHTGFCGSTLLARILQKPPRVMVLREPRVLLDLAHARHRIADAAATGGLTAALSLLARPWVAGGTCLVKPTNQTNNLLPQLLQASNGRAILLYSSLPEFILSRCSKLPAAERFVRWLAQHLLRQSRLADALSVPWNHEFHFIEACVLAWHAQIEIFAAALAVDAADRLRSLDFATLLAAPDRIVPACARWLGLGQDDGFWQARATAEMRRNAKHVDRDFDAGARARERSALRDRHRGLLDAAMNWNEHVVAPVASMPANWKPLLAASP